MATGYTLEQLSKLNDLLFQKDPRPLGSDDVGRASVPPSISTATVPTSGILVNFGPDKRGRDQLQFLTPVVARQLVRGIGEQGSPGKRSRRNRMARGQNNAEEDMARMKARIKALRERNV